MAESGDTLLHHILNIEKTGELPAMVAEPDTRNPELVQQLEICQQFPGEHIQCLLSSGEEHVYAPGEVIVKAGHEADRVYILMEGSARVVYHAGAASAPQWAVVDILGAGRLFGLVPALNGEPYVAQLEALTTAKLLSVGREAFLSELRQHPVVAMNLLKQLTSYVRKTERWLVTAF